MRMIHTLALYTPCPREGRENGVNCVEFMWLYLTQNELHETHVIRCSFGSLPDPEKVPLLCADCTKFASLAIIVGGWCEICSVHEQFSLVCLIQGDSSSCADCTEFASPAVFVDEWREICSVCEQFSLSSCKD